MPERVIKLIDHNRIGLPKEALNDLNISIGDYVLVRWHNDDKKIEIVPVDIIPKKDR